MKTILHLLLGGTMLLASCSGAYKLGNTATKDDVYASGSNRTETPSSTPSTSSESEVTQPQEKTNPNIGDDNARRSESYDDQDQYVTEDGDGDTYVTNNYYDYDDEDFYYTRHMRRWYQPTIGFGYFSSVYYDPFYWWGPAYYSPGVSIHFNIGPTYHWHNPYYYSYAYPSYYPWYGGWTPYGYNYGYANGYNHGYWNGFYDGYYGNNPYGGYYGYNDYYYYNTGYSGGGGSGVYYGHHSSQSTNGNGNVEALGNGNKVEAADKSHVDLQTDAVKANPGVKTDAIEKGKVENAQPSQGKFDQVDAQKGTPNKTGDIGKENTTVNSDRAGKFDNAPNAQTPKGAPHKGSMSVDVNPRTQVKPQPDVQQPKTQQQRPRYQWEEAQPRNNGSGTQQRNNDAPDRVEPQQPRDERFEDNGSRDTNDDNYVPQQRNDTWTPNGYDRHQAPRNDEQPRWQQRDEPRYEERNQTPRYEAPRQEQPQQRTYKNDDAPRNNSKPEYREQPRPSAPQPSRPNDDNRSRGPRKP